MADKNRPPRSLVWLLLHILPKYIDHSALGDFEEEYASLAAERGRAFANRGFALDIVKSIPPFIADAIRFKLVMLKNYATITWRNIKNHKTYSFLNISGLAIGMACCLLIALWISDERSYDRFHENRDRLYRVVVNAPSSGTMRRIVATPPPLGPALKTEFPDIVETARLSYWGSVPLRAGDQVFNENRMIVVEPSFFSLFTFPMIAGEGAASLGAPDSALLSRSRAESLFGSEEPIGKVIKIDNRFDYVVRGVFRDIPPNTHIGQFDLVLPWSHLDQMEWYDPDSWGALSYRTYALLGEKASLQDVNPKIAKLIQRHFSDSKNEILLEPVADIHLHSRYRLSTGLRGIAYVYIFSFIALLVLLIACVNFMNLSTARFFNRAREIGMRKTLGALRPHLMAQFFGESLFMTIYALGLALALVRLVLPTFNSFIGKQMAFHSLLDWPAVLGLLGFTGVTGLLAGSYPAIYLSSFRPVQALSKAVRTGKAGSGFRRTLVVLQFSLSVILIIGTLVVYAQLDFIRNRKIGWEREQLISLDLSGGTNRSFGILKAELLELPGVMGVTAAYSEPTNFESSSSGVSWQGKNEEETVHVTLNLVDEDFVSTLGIGLAEGRPFSRELPSDATRAFLINETLARMMGMESPVGAKFSFIGREGEIIGVMRDFHFHSLRTSIGPVAVALGSDDFWRFALVRIHQADMSSTLEAVKTLWTKRFPLNPFTPHFMEEAYEGQYRSEERMGQLINVFAGLAVFVACLGLLGLTSFAIEQRRKEIGIRKALGASAGNVLWNLEKEFLSWVIGANVLAWPIAYIAMSGWLRNFAYRIKIGVAFFVLASLMSIAIALAAVAVQSLRAATSNPTDSLRYE
jgi:putative ABC transport system permease protein